MAKYRQTTRIKKKIDKDRFDEINNRNERAALTYKNKSNK